MPKQQRPTATWNVRSTSAQWLVACGRRFSGSGTTLPRRVSEDIATTSETASKTQLLFRVERSRAVLAKTPDFLELAGAVSVPAAKRSTPWDEVLRRTRRERAGRRR
jgi:hypothetical protein